MKFLFILIKLLYVTVISIYVVLEICAETLNKTIYMFYGNEIIINLYNTLKNNRFQIKAKHIQNFVDEKSIGFKELEIFIFNEKNIPIWKISCDQAQLIEQKFIDLCGYVYINKIVNNKCTESIITKQVLMNLEDQNISSNSKTIIHGSYFYSISSKMYVDLETHTIRLFGKIYTQYEIE